MISSRVSGRVLSEHMDDTELDHTDANSGFLVTWSAILYL